MAVVIPWLGNEAARSNRLGSIFIMTSDTTVYWIFVTFPVPQLLFVSTVMLNSFCNKGRLNKIKGKL